MLNTINKKMNVIVKYCIASLGVVTLLGLLFVFSLYSDSERLVNSSYSLGKMLVSPNCDPLKKSCDFLSFRDVLDVFHSAEDGRGVVIYFRRVSSLRSVLDSQSIKNISIWVPTISNFGVNTYEFVKQNNIKGIYTENGSTINDFCVGIFTDGTVTIYNKGDMLNVELDAHLEIVSWYQGLRKCKNQSIHIKFKSYSVRMSKSGSH